MACCSSQCERKHLCAHYIDNPRETDGLESVESYYWFGSGSISSEGCENHWWCGPHGDWGMFTPINVELLKKQRDALDRTIKELENGIINIAQSYPNRTADTCKDYKPNGLAPWYERI